MYTPDLRLFVRLESWLLNLFQSVRRFKPADALHDAIAGWTLAAMNIPQALGYTKIAGMPVITGLYTLLLPLVGFAAFGSSRYLVVAADSATAAIFAGGALDLAPAASGRYVALAGATALLTAGFLLLHIIPRLNRKVRGKQPPTLNEVIRTPLLPEPVHVLEESVQGPFYGVEDRRCTHECLPKETAGPILAARSACVETELVSVLARCHRGLVTLVRPSECIPEGSSSWMHAKEVGASRG